MKGTWINGTSLYFKNHIEILAKQNFNAKPYKITEET